MQGADFGKAVPTHTYKQRLKVGDRIPIAVKAISVCKFYMAMIIHLDPIKVQVIEGPAAGTFLQRDAFNFRYPGHDQNI